MRKVEFRIPQNNYEANNPDFLVADPTEIEYEHNLVESKLLEIDELTNGDTFGEDAYLLTPKGEIPYSVVTNIPTEVFLLDIHDFNHLG